MTSRAQPVGPWRKYQRPQPPRNENAARYGERGQQVPIEDTISAYERWVKERKARNGR